MNYSIMTGEYILKMLSSNEDLKSYVGDQIFPLIANSDTKFPFIVFSRTGIVPEYTKDGLTEDEVRISIIAVSDKYLQCLEIANLIRNTLELKRFRDNDVYINSIRLESVSESYQENSFLQILNFIIKM